MTSAVVSDTIIFFGELQNKATAPGGIYVTLTHVRRQPL